MSVNTDTIRINAVNWLKDSNIGTLIDSNKLDITLDLKKNAYDPDQWGFIGVKLVDPSNENDDYDLTRKQIYKFQNNYWFDLGHDLIITATAEFYFGSQVDPTDVEFSLDLF